MMLRPISVRTAGRCLAPGDRFRAAGGRWAMPEQTSRPVERFPSTHWSLVGRAGGVGTGAAPDAGRGALSTLLRQYLPPMKVYLVRKRRLGPDEAEELLQAFVAEKVLDGRFVAAA